MVVSSPHHPPNLDFAALLRQRRRALDLTRTELARRVGCSPDTIKKIEEGERRPSKELAELLAAHLQIDTPTRASFVRLARARGDHLGDATPNNLPAPLTSFIGRRHEVEYVDARLRRGDVRLLTVVGPPGVGKSRLAMSAADHLRDAFPDGVWFVPLATIEEPEQALLLIAKTLGVVDDPQATVLEDIIRTLRSRRALLVLDNFEQILDVAPAITEILSACAQVAALVTSRNPLEVYGEQQYALLPLAVPPAAAWQTPDTLQDYAAVALFLDRIQAHTPTFSLTPSNSAAVAELCARLDGIPLAIELAAGLTRAEAPHLLLTDMAREGSLALLTTTQRDRLARQQTLRAAIAWSVHRLTAADQVLFARLGVFHGSFDLEAAHAVVMSLPQTTQAMSMTEFGRHVQALAASHLINIEAGSETPRYRLLETLREYALDALHAARESRLAQRAHAAHYAALAYAVDPAQSLGNLYEWRDQLRPDYPNLLAALHFALNDQDVDLALKLASGLGHYWYLEGGWQEGVRWLTAALALPGGAMRERVRANSELGILHSTLGHYPEAEHHLRLAYETASATGDLLATAWALSHLGQVALLQGQNDVTRTYTQERLQIFRRIGNTRYLAITLEQMGCAAIEEGDYTRGIPWLEECQEYWTAQGSRAGIASVCAIIGMAELAQGDAPAALARFQQAYAEFAAIQHSHGLPWSLRNLGLAQLVLGQLPQAQASLLRAFEQYAVLTGDETSTAVVVEAIAGIATRRGQHELAGNLIGAASVIRAQSRLPLTENSHQIYERLLAASQKALGAAGWQQAVAAGKTLSWTEAVESARTLLVPPAVPHNNNSAPSKAK